MSFGNPSLASVLPRGVPPLGVFASNQILVVVYATASGTVNGLEVLPGMATLQDEDGRIIASLHVVPSNPNSLAPGCLSCPQRTSFAAVFAPTLHQSRDLLGGRWFLQINAVTSSGEDYPAGTIRGYIPAFAPQSTE